MSLRWGEVICSIIFLIITVFVQIKVEDEFKKRLLKVNFEQIIFRDRFSDSQIPQMDSNKQSDNSSNSLSLQIPRKNFGLNESQK